VLRLLQPPAAQVAGAPLQQRQPGGQAEHVTELGQVAQEEIVDLPDEARVIIEPTGQVVLNEQQLDAPADTSLPELRAVLTRFRLSAENAKTEALVTLAPHDTVPHQRLVDVLNACAEAGIRGVTLAGATDE
jgi:biopolymer transport protein ExbD